MVKCICCGTDIVHPPRIKIVEEVAAVLLDEKWYKLQPGICRFLKILWEQSPNPVHIDRLIFALDKNTGDMRTNEQTIRTYASKLRSTFKGTDLNLLNSVNSRYQLILIPPDTTD